MNWSDVITLSKQPAAGPAIVKPDAEWKAELTPEQYRITRQHGTERAFTGEHCRSYAPGIYSCVCCGTELFDSRVKFESGTGWPSFTEPVTGGVIRYKLDSSWGMDRVEVLCQACDAHLGHVFPDGPKPSGLRFCINSASLAKKEEGRDGAADPELATATMGGGCFWCIEAILDELSGVTGVQSGYAGGATEHPGYQAVCGGQTGHAEVVQVTFDPRIIGYGDLLKVFFIMHNPTTRNRQGADVGTQYRSVVFYHDDDQKATAEAVIAELQPYFDKPIVTELSPLPVFYPAEAYHQSYYKSDPAKNYCQSVITPKLAKMREHFKAYLKPRPA
jgi:peptide methionine sulfoxide reductase msrA/msrB